MPKKGTLPNGRTFYAKYKKLRRSNLLPIIKVQKTYDPRQRRSGGMWRKEQGQGFKTIIRSVIRKSRKVVKRIYNLGEKDAGSNVGKLMVHERIKQVSRV